MRHSSAVNTDYDGSSSPDPLASSINSQPVSSHKSHRRLLSSEKGRQTKAPTPHESGTNLPRSSPSRLVTEQTLSPWKIRVTVETEPEHQDVRQYETVTRTVHIPVRGSSSPAQPDYNTMERVQKQDRMSSNSKGCRRSITPSTERRRRQSVTDLDVMVLGDEADEDEWTNKPKRKSPRKLKAKKITKNQTTEVSATSDRGAFDVRPDTDTEEAGNVLEREDTPELRQIDLNSVSVRTRSNSSKQKGDFPLEIKQDDLGTKFKSKPLYPNLDRRNVSANSAMTYPTPSPTASERGVSVEVEAFDDIDRDQAEGFDTIMESEGFTMIDLDSLPSVKQMLSSPLEGQALGSANQSESPVPSESSVVRKDFASTSENDRSPEPVTSYRTPRLVLPEGVSEISSTVPSSPPAFEDRSQFVRQKSPLSHLSVPTQPRNRQVTPQTYASPKLPSPPKQPVSKDRATPNSAKASRAGLALQNAVSSSSPPVQQAVLSVASHTRSSSGEIFDGFDSCTQRELRAGLRFGEELAKRQINPNSPHAASESLEKPVTASIWRGETVMSRTPVQIQVNQGQSRDSRHQSPEEPPKTQTPFVKPRASILYSDTAKRDQQWALERKAVSRQIENAIPAKVIVIDSDAVDELSLEQNEHPESMHDVTMGDEEGDIWLAEAKDASSSPRQGSESSLMTETANAVAGSRYNAKPSLHKHENQTDQNNSTIMTTGEEQSGMFWKQQAQDDVRFGNAAINNVRKELRKSGDTAFWIRRNSGAFDISKMLGTPKRIKDRIEKEGNQQTLASKPCNVAHSILDQTHVTVDEQQWDETSEESASSPSSQNLQLLPVKFNDTKLSEQQTTPPLTSRSRLVLPQPARPPTPRSAMKGSRQSFGLIPDQNIDRQDNLDRRVVFAERSKTVNVDWVESSSSIRSSAEDECSSPIVEHQKHQEERQMVLSSPMSLQDDALPEENSPAQEDTVTSHEPVKKSWLGWLWKANQNQIPIEDNKKTPPAQVDGTMEPPVCVQSFIPQENDWAPTSHNPTSTRQTSRPTSIIPSYLTTPSYPSDPKRSLSTPLKTSGPFTNHHFRTLHILHRKSQRPRFHAPAFNTCRSEIRDLVSRKWQLYIDESDAGLGGFNWTLGQTEARVLERFCRELEFDALRHECVDDDEVEEAVDEWLGASGIWGGRTDHSSGGVEWEWTVEQLATHLGRIVVGEVVRDEEHGGRKSHP